MFWLVTVALAADPPPNVWPKGVPYPPEGIPRPDGAVVAEPATVAVAVDRAATSSIQGRILEMGSGIPVSEGTIGLGPEGGPPRWTTPLPADGRFAFPVAPGTYDLTYEGTDHRPVTARVQIGEREEVTVDLRADRGTWETITVYGEPHREEVTRRVITADELLLVPGSFGDPIRALQSLPGVARPATLEGDIIVRGAEAVNTGTYIDEIPVPYLFHFFIGRSVVNPALIDDVEFYAGGMPSRFGDVTQAVVNARTLDTQPKPGFHGRVSADVLDFAVSGEARLSDAFTVQGGYRLSWITGLVTGGVRVYATLKGLGDFRPAFPSLAYEDHLARVAWEQGQDRVVLTFLGAHDALILHPPRMDYDGDGDVEDPPETADLPYDPWRLMDSGFQRVQLRWDRNHLGREQATWLALGPDHEESLLQGLGTIADGIDFGRLNGWTILAKRQDRIALGKDAIRFGADALVVPVTVIDYAHLDEDDQAPTTKEVRTSIGLWGEYQAEVGDAFVAPGVRLATHVFNDQTKVEPEPRVTLRKPIDRRWTGTAFIGRFTQVPPADRYADGIGNPAITRMTSYQASIGVEGRWPSGIELDGTLYASRMDDLVVKDVRVEVREVQNVGDYSYGGPAGYAESVYVPTFKSVRGYAFGLEGMARMRPNGPQFGWVALSIGKSLRVDEGVVRPGDYDMPFSLTAVYARELPWGFRVSGKFRVTSGYPYTPTDAVYLSDEDHWHGLTGLNNSERFPLYRQLDVRIDHTWIMERARWIAYLDMFNALNTKNWMLATYTPNLTRLVPTIWMPILPTLGVEVRY